MKKRQKKHVSKEEKPRTRSSSTSIENSKSITVDLIAEIFSRLTAKSLSRLRCLSKEWSSTFSSKHFTDSFLTSSSSRPRLLFTFHVNGKLFFYSAGLPRNPDQDLSYVITVDSHMPIPTSMEAFLIQRPVRGLICPSGTWLNRGSSNDSKMMMICNPSTGEFKTFPAARIKKVHVRTYLGYDPIKEEHKVLCMSLCRGTHPTIFGDHQVLTLGTGKLFWRMIECSIDQYPESGGICINGVLYYSASRENNVFQRVFNVICFDVSSEKFKPLEMNLTCSPTLINYKGKLGAIQFDSADFFRGRTTSLDLRVLDDAEQNKWSKKTFMLPPFWKSLGVAATRLNVVGMTSESEIVFSPSILSDPFYIFYYHVGRNASVKVRVQGIDFVKSQYIYTFIDHVENIKPM